MDINFELENLARRAKNDIDLRNKLLQTQYADDPLKEFCNICQSLGYEQVTVYQMATAGEEFCAAMLRSVNGGGVEAPDEWDDFYAMFIAQLKEM